MALATSLCSACGDVPLLDMTVGQLLQDAAAVAPDKVALISVAPQREAREWTYAELLDDAERAAAWLLQRFEPGENVAVWAPNVPEWLVLQYGAALAGLVLVTINPALRSAELSHAFNASRSVGVFYVDNFRGSDMAAVVDAVVPGVGTVREAVSFAGWLDTVRQTVKLEKLPDVDPQSPTQVQFTSGTTGRPKPAVLKHMAMVTNAAYVRERCGAPAGATFGTALPMFHTAGCGLAVMGSFVQHATVVVAEVFDPTTVLAAMQDHRVEAFGGVPLMLHTLLAHPDFAGYDLSALKVVMSGGDAVPADLAEAWTTRAGVGISAVYGQTELSPIVLQTRPSDTPQDGLHTAGQPLPNVDVAVTDPATGTVQPIGVQGELVARGYQVMLGYLDMPDETAKTIDADGWLHTGDLGVMDDRSYVTITGRLKDLIIRGGENIDPREVEDALATHPAVTRAIVLGQRDAAWGETVAAVVQLDPASEAPTPDQLQEYMRDRLAPHKTPKSWYVADELPLNAMGKLQKFRLRDQIAAGELRQL